MKRIISLAASDFRLILESTKTIEQLTHKSEMRLSYLCSIFVVVILLSSSLIVGPTKAQTIDFAIKVCDGFCLPDMEIRVCDGFWIVPLLSVGACPQQNSPCQVLGFCKETAFSGTFPPVYSDCSRFSEEQHSRGRLPSYRYWH